MSCRRMRNPFILHSWACRSSRTCCSSLAQRCWHADFLRSAGRAAIQEVRLSFDWPGHRCLTTHAYRVGSRSRTADAPNVRFRASSSVTMKSATGRPLPPAGGLQRAGMLRIAVVGRSTPRRAGRPPGPKSHVGHKPSSTRGCSGVSRPVAIVSSRNSSNVEVFTP